MNIMGLYGELEQGSKYAKLKGHIESAYLTMVVRSFGGGSNLRLRSDIATRGMACPGTAVSDAGEEIVRFRISACIPEYRIIKIILEREDDKVDFDYNDEQKC